MKWRKFEATAIVRGKAGGGTTRPGHRNTRCPRRTFLYKIELILDSLHPADEEGGDILPGSIDHFVSHDSKALRERGRARRSYYDSKIFIADLTDLGKEVIQEPIRLIHEK